MPNIYPGSRGRIITLRLPFNSDTMIEKEIKHIAYRLQQLKDKPTKAIVFIGAGCSISADIPRASVIVKEVLEKHKDNPEVADKSGKVGLTYAEVMNCLEPHERRDLFAEYVSRANINVSHIYLAYLMKLGYVDYIVTTNFDNLTLRALALYNIFPPVYDLSNLKDLTTTTLNTQSVIYLHGQHHGLWQLNTETEMNRIVKEEGAGLAINIFSKIANGRPWIVLGYSGDDFVFDALAAQGRFDNSLYWVGYKDDEPTPRVKERLLDDPNKQGFWIKGYDADSFFLKLAAELKLDQPAIFNKPFSFVAEVLQGIVDIDDTEIYKDVKQRLNRSGQMVEDAIGYYELGSASETRMTDADIELIQLEQKLTDILLKGDYEQVESLKDEVMAHEDADLLEQLAGIYNNWGLKLQKVVVNEAHEAVINHYQAIFDKYEKSTTIKPDMSLPWNNWGNALGDLALRKAGEEAEVLRWQSFEKYAKAIEIEPEDHDAWNNWGTGLADLAQRKDGATAEALWRQSFEKYAKALEIKPDYYQVWGNWGNALGGLAKRKEGVESEALLKQSLGKYIRAVEIKPDYYQAWGNWGNALDDLAQRKMGGAAEALWHQSFEKYAKVVEIKPDDEKAWYNWGCALTHLWNHSGKEDKNLYDAAKAKLIKAMRLGANSYNLSCLYALGNQPEKAFPLLAECLDKKEISFAHVAKDNDWDGLRDAPEYLALKEKYGG